MQFLYIQLADNGHLMSRSENALKLKTIRERAVGLRELARLIGWDASRYQYYEDLYKKPYMPPDLVELIRPHLVGRGDPPVSDAELDSLLPPRRSPLPVEPSLDGGDVLEGVGAHIRSTREARGISVRDLARLVGLNHAVLSRIESDDFKPKDDMLRKIARTLGLDGEDLVSRARRDADISELIMDPRSRRGVDALLRTAGSLPPERFSEFIKQIREKADKSKP